MMQLDVMTATQPPDVQRFVISVVMGVDGRFAADFAALPFQRSRGKRAANRKMSRIFGQIGPAPVCLTGPAFQQWRARSFGIIRHHAAACRCRVR